MVFFRLFFIMVDLARQIINQIERANNILLTFPIERNGDALAGALALSLFLTKAGKNVELAAGHLNENKSSVFNFLPNAAAVKDDLENLAKFIISIDISNAKVDQIKYVINENTLSFIISPKAGWFDKESVRTSTSGYKYDLIIALNAPDLESLGKIYDNNVDFFYKTTIINIDHNSNNEEFGQINLVELNAVSVTEILFDLFKDYRPELIDADIATCLLTGIIFKTKSFKTPNLTPHTLAATSELIRLGARREEIVNYLYRSRPLSVLKLWGRVLNNLQSSEDGQTIWSWLYKDDFAAVLSGEEDLDEVMEELAANMPQAKVLTLFYSLSEIKKMVGENNDHEETETIIVHENKKEPIFNTKAIVYCFKNVNALDLMKEYGPSGTRKVAYLKISQPLKKTAQDIITLIKAKLDKIGL